jgi:hypothetical protein
VQRGDKALRERDWPTAQAQYRKAIDEDPTHLLAHAGLADALLGAGDKGAAILELRAAVQISNATKDMPKTWLSTAARLRKSLADLDAASVAIDKITDTYVTGLLALADRFVAKDPDTVAAVLADVRRLRPDEPRAKALAEKLFKADAASWTPLFDGKDKAGWDWMESSGWWVTQGCLACNVLSTALIAKTKVSYRGDFDVRMEAKFVKRYGDAPAFGLLALMKGEYDHPTFGVEIERVSWVEEHTKTSFETIVAVTSAELKHPIDFSDWNTYEMRFRGDQMQAVLNGQVLRTMPRPKERDEGTIGLRVQTAQVQFRRVEVRQR